MQLEQIQLPVTNLLYADYIAHEDKTQQFFEYNVSNKSFEQRAAYLQTQHYQFQQVADAVEKYMAPYSKSEVVKENIALLRNGALAIVGGQQAGILTGPLYSVHKAITVLLLAKKQSELLAQPIVPVFWIAGEDHDIEEINHTYTMTEQDVKKRAYSKRSHKKTMASYTEFDQQEMHRAITQIFADYGETSYTNELLTTVKNAIDSTTTFTQFFTKLMNELFDQFGLLMIDAADETLRQIESNYFVRLIEQSETIAKKVFAQEQKLASYGYPKPIEANENGVNLFYVENGERHLLEWDAGIARNKAAMLKFTKDELIKIAQQTPERLSNNVVTRPVMQEMVFPVLAFVGGPGELAYWATLKPAFEQMNLQMPIFVPRMQMTFVTRQSQAILNKLNLTIEDVFSGKAKEQLNTFLQEIEDQTAIAAIQQLQQTLQQAYASLEQHLQSQSVNLTNILEKNSELHSKHLQYLQSKVTEQVQLKHSVQIKRFETLRSEFTPVDSLQERIYSPYKYMNEVGTTLIAELMALPFEVNTKHNVVYF